MAGSTHSPIQRFHLGGGPWGAKNQPRPRDGDGVGWRQREGETGPGTEDGETGMGTKGLGAEGQSDRALGSERPQWGA